MGYPARKRSAAKAVKLKPGTYEATIAAVYDADGFVSGDAFTLEHKVTCEGNAVVYKETFINAPDAQRTQAFFDFIESCGYSCDDLEALVGVKEKLTFLKQYRGNGVYLNVYAREFLDEVPAE